MSDIELVIKIPEDTVDKIKDNTMFAGSISSEILWDVTNAIVNGIALTKGHGKLIDVNDLLDRIGLEDNDRNREDNVGEIITLEDFDFTPTIIEADKGSEDAE